MSKLCIRTHILRGQVTGKDRSLERNLCLWTHRNSIRVYFESSYSILCNLSVLSEIIGCEEVSFLSMLYLLEQKESRKVYLSNPRNAYFRLYLSASLDSFRQQPPSKTTEYCVLLSNRFIVHDFCWKSEADHRGNLELSLFFCIFPYLAFLLSILSFILSIIFGKYCIRSSIQFLPNENYTQKFLPGTRPVNSKGIYHKINGKLPVSHNSWERRKKLTGEKLMTVMIQTIKAELINTIILMKRRRR